MQRNWPLRPSLRAAKRAPWLLAAALTSVLSVAATAAPASAASFDDCAVRLVTGKTYVFVSQDDPNAVTDQTLWGMCTGMVQTGYAVSISTKTPMSGGGNQLVCSVDSGATHVHVWAAPDSFNTRTASQICDQADPALITWWPLG
jgi:hypothetical protein